MRLRANHKRDLRDVGIYTTNTFSLHSDKPAFTFKTSTTAAVTVIKLSKKVILYRVLPLSLVQLDSKKKYNNITNIFKKYVKLINIQTCSKTFECNQFL